MKKLSKISLSPRQTERYSREIFRFATNNFCLQGKKGWLHVIEAFLAVLILIGILFFQIKDISSSPTENILTIERTLIKEVARNTTLKEEILNYPLPTVLDSGSSSEVAMYISSRIPSGVDFKVMVCTTDDPCVVNQKGAIAQDVFIASTVNIYSPRKFKIFMWATS